MLHTVDTKIVQYQAKRADPFYMTPFWRELRLSVLKRDRFQCVLCGARAFIVDHIVARKRGGLDEPSNLRSLCRACDNRFKETPTGERKSQGVAAGR